MVWQFPPLGACLGLLLISIGVVVGFDLRFKIDSKDSDSLDSHQNNHE